jgi:hypothetical protein
MNQTNHFIDLGYGWLCKHCSAADAEAKQHSHETRRGFFSRGHQEKLETPPLVLALASWTDSSRNSLFCPRCGIHEAIKS